MTSKIALATLSLAAIALLTTPATAPAQTAAPPSPRATPAQANTEAEAAPIANDAAHQGIKIHGHWKITVLNPDRTVVSSRDIENSLLEDGAEGLTGMLIGQAVPSFWALNLTSTSAASPCGPPPQPGIRALCQVSPVNSPPNILAGCAAAGSQVCGLNLTTTEVGSSFGLAGFHAGFRLAGSFTAANAGVIEKVTSAIVLCNSSGVTPHLCQTGGGQDYHDFSSTTFAPIAVGDGQIVQVSVTFSFS